MGGYAHDLSNIQNMIRDYVGGGLPGRYCVLPKPEKTLNICKLQLQPLFIYIWINSTVAFAEYGPDLWCFTVLGQTTQVLI